MTHKSKTYLRSMLWMALSFVAIHGVVLSCSKSAATDTAATDTTDETGATAPVAVSGTNLTDASTFCKKIGDYVDCNLRMKTTDSSDKVVYKALTSDSFDSKADSKWTSENCSAVTDVNTKSEFKCKPSDATAKFSISNVLSYDGVEHSTSVSSDYIPAILAATPSLVSAGDTLKITGLSFSSTTVAKVMLGGTECTSLSIVSTTVATCTVPTLSASGAVDLVLIGDKGITTAEKASAVSYGKSTDTYPSITSVTLSGNGLSVTIDGSNFTSSVTVVADSQTCTTSSVSTTTIVCTVSKAITSSPTVSVVCSDGKGAAWIP